MRKLTLAWLKHHTDSDSRNVVALSKAGLLATAFISNQHRPISMSWELARVKSVGRVRQACRVVAQNMATNAANAANKTTAPSSNTQLNEHMSHLARLGVPELDREPLAKQAIDKANEFTTAVLESPELASQLAHTFYGVALAKPTLPTATVITTTPYVPISTQPSKPTRRTIYQEIGKASTPEAKVSDRDKHIHSNAVAFGFVKKGGK